MFAKVLDTLEQIKQKEAEGESNMDHFDMMVDLREQLECAVSGIDPKALSVAIERLKN